MLLCCWVGLLLVCVIVSLFDCLFDCKFAFCCCVLGFGVVLLYGFEV